MTPRRINYFSAIKSSSSWPPAIDVITHISNNSLNVLIEMASSCCMSSSPFSSSECTWKLLILSPSRRNNMRRRCTHNKYFMGTGFFLVLGMIILVAQLPSVLCRALKEGDNTSKQINVYEHLSDDSHGLLTSSYRRGSSIDVHEKEDGDDSSSETIFESQRKFLPHSLTEPDANNKKNISNRSENVNSLEVIKKFIANNDDSRLNGNSSMIVHVIVTSSSSTSSGSIELDETDNHSSSNNEDTFQYTVSEDEGDGNLVAAPSSESQISAVNPSAIFQREPAEDLVQKHVVEDDDRGNFSPQKSQFSYTHSSQFSHHDDNLELKRLPTPENQAPDIFSAFYRAFSQSSESTPTPTIKSLPQSSPPKLQSDQPSIFPDSKNPVETITTFRIPSRPDFRQRPSSIQLFQQRRRLLRNRQLMERKSLNLSLPTPVPSGTIAAEETARKLEYLARKLDTSEIEQSFGGQHDKILAVSSSSSPLITTTTQTPFLLPQNSRRTQSITPSKIAVSVTHTKSVVAPPATTVTKKTEVDPAAAVVREEVRKNVRSHATFPHALSERENIHNTYSTFIQSRPLVKSLPRNQDGDQEDDNINNKNRGNKHIFPKNFSTYDLQQENGSLRKSYESASSSVNGDERNFSSEKDSNNHNDEINGTNFQIQDRHNIISRSEDGRDTKFSGNLPDHTSAFDFPGAGLRTPVQRRKITRTVSDQIGNPSSFFFNFNVDFESTPRSKPKIPVVAKQTQLPPNSKSTPKPVNWQQPEQIWGEPAKVWSTPAKVWSEPARIWSEPARVWSQPEKVWNERKLEEEMMQSDQPPEERKGDEPSSDGTFVILGDDETEGDSIDGDLGRPLMLHHFTVPPNKQKETVSVSTSVSSSVSKNQQSSSNKNTSIFSINGSSTFETVPFSRKVAEPSTLQETHLTNHRQPHQQYDTSSNLSNFNNSTSDSTNNSDTDQQAQSKKSGKKFGYVIEGANVRKYRVEERTPDGYIVGEYGVLNNQNAFLRGVRYTADGTINPRLIHEALMKFLSLRRR